MSHHHHQWRPHPPPPPQQPPPHHNIYPTRQFHLPPPYDVPPPPHDPHVPPLDRRPYRNPNFEADPYGQPPRRRLDCSTGCGNYYPMHLDDDFSIANPSLKRVRVDNDVVTASGALPRAVDGSICSSGGPLSGNERILRLIREHGSAPELAKSNEEFANSNEGFGYFERKRAEFEYGRDGFGRDYVGSDRSGEPVKDYMESDRNGELARPPFGFGRDYVGSDQNGELARPPFGFGRDYFESDRNGELGRPPFDDSIPPYLSYDEDCGSRQSRRLIDLESSRFAGNFPRHDELLHRDRRSPRYNGGSDYFNDDNHSCRTDGRLRDVQVSKYRRDDVFGRRETPLDDRISHGSGFNQQLDMNQRGQYSIPDTPNEYPRDFQRLPPNDVESHYSLPTSERYPPSYTAQRHFQPAHDFDRLHSPNVASDVSISRGSDVYFLDGVQSSVSHQKPHGWTRLGEDQYPDIPRPTNLVPEEVSRVYSIQPPLPTSPPPPLPVDQPTHHFGQPVVSTPAPKSLFPIAVSSSVDMLPSHLSAAEAPSVGQSYYASKQTPHASNRFSTEDVQAHRLSSEYLVEGQPLLPRNLSLEKQCIVDAAEIFKQPHRANRPDHIVVILRGLPGSGKSYLAKMLRDLEVENGGQPPRIYSMDEYFMTEVEKVDESVGSARGKKPVMKKVMEFCYEPEMEEAYRSSMLKAFKKTLDEGVFSFIIVDDRNLRVADFAQFWATAKRSGYEVYLLEATYKDPAGCAARNVHGFTQADIHKMAQQWEEAPSLYLKLDIKPLLHGDNFEESGIQEVDMDMEDEDPVNDAQGSEEVTKPEPDINPMIDDLAPNVPLKDDNLRSSVHNHAAEVRELRKSKWSDDLDDNDSHGNESRKGNSSALSGLIQAYSNEGKSVRWGDQVKNIGFSIGAAKRTNITSLVIGPGSGYNLKSNPLSEEEDLTSNCNAAEPKKKYAFQEHLRAERESFKAVFDRRRQRIGMFNTDEE